MDDQRAQLLRLFLEKKEANPNYNHPHIREIELYNYVPQQLYKEGIAMVDGLRWFFTKENRSWRLDRPIKIFVINMDSGVEVILEEKSYRHTIDREWHMKKYKLEAAEWALCSVCPGRE